ncbi:hypothetical protein [Streptomyces sp. V3I7]|uniref:hypothetical protein n=1 Tax=Streptomyces sp. V3I7 TaxID=3042278 RepID=UPI002788850A|nr:hypothetical protein [Streptomyces sp. V3I7]MDQ0992185.1 hypothetical protein [Streptomyces sp. V3I7]
MKALLFGALLGVLLLWPPALPLTATLVTAVAKPAVLGFGAGALARPVLARTFRRWAR